MNTTDLSPRWRHELRRAIDTDGTTMVELLDPASLSVVPIGDGTLDILSNGSKVGTLPLHRVDPIDRTLAAQAIVTTASHLAQHNPELHDVAAAIAEAAHADRFVLAEPHETDTVYAYVMTTETTTPTEVKLYRPCLVPTWPHDDWPDPPEGFITLGSTEP